MGFCYYHTGNVHYCWIEDGYVFEELKFSGHINKYPTRLSVNIPRQCNLFNSDNVVFKLIHNGLVYIGRRDGGISLYRQSDNLLVGLNNWDAPKYLPLSAFGFYKIPGSLQEMLLDKRDRQTFYVRYLNIEGLLYEPLLDSVSETWGLCYVLEDSSLHNWFIQTERGDIVGIKEWSVQESLWRGDYPLYD